VTLHLTCCCCGGDAPAYQQWWNRDKGYGLCGRCATTIKARKDSNFVFDAIGHELANMTNPLSAVGTYHVSTEDGLISLQGDNL
jgi:hypothetical protein